jgi:hypothetical protein
MDPSLGLRFQDVTADPAVLNLLMDPSLGLRFQDVTADPAVLNLLMDPNLSGVGGFLASSGVLALFSPSGVLALFSPSGVVALLAANTRSTSGWVRVEEAAEVFGLAIPGLILPLSFKARAFASFCRFSSSS